MWWTEYEFKAGSPRSCSPGETAAAIEAREAYEAMNPQFAFRGPSVSNFLGGRLDETGIYA